MEQKLNPLEQAKINLNSCEKQIRDPCHKRIIKPFNLLWLINDNKMNVLLINSLQQNRIIGVSAMTFTHKNRKT